MDTRADREPTLVTRRRFLRGSVCSILTLAGAGALAGCALRAGQDPAQATPSAEPLSIVGGPAAAEAPAPSVPYGSAMVRVEGIADLTFQAQDVSTVRPDVFQEGHFSLFDVLVHLHDSGALQLAYHYDDGMGTHVIDGINGIATWWYDAFYAGGWSERSNFRMDLYPYKRGTTMRLHRESEQRIGDIHRTYREEMTRLAANGGDVWIPEVKIRSPRGSWSFMDVGVTAHNMRVDLFKPGVITAIDALLSLQERGELSSIGLTWYDRIGAADPVETYFVEQINSAVAAGGCGFVYEVGPKSFDGFEGNHIHLPSDARVILAPEYASWFWLCL